MVIFPHRCLISTILFTGSDTNYFCCHYFPEWMNHGQRNNTQHNESQHNNTQHYSAHPYTQCRCLIFIVMLSVVVLSVVYAECCDTILCTIKLSNSSYCSTRRDCAGLCASSKMSVGTLTAQQHTGK